MLVVYRIDSSARAYPGTVHWSAGLNTIHIHGNNFVSVTLNISAKLVWIIESFLVHDILRYSTRRYVVGYETTIIDNHSRHDIL